MTSEEKKYFLGFSFFPGIGPLRFKLLREYFGSAKKAWYSSKQQLLEIGLGESLTSRFVNFRTNFSLDDYLKKIADLKIEIITNEDKLYPQLLKEISDAPFVLYIRGNLKYLQNLHKTIAVVGTRKITNYGREVTQKITRQLSLNGCVIVSGLAYGVDTVAHQSAVEMDGRTIAVLGCGVDIIHPTSNTKLYWEIIKKYGLVLSEFPVGQYASKGLFPARNRIISGLSLGVVVTEGAKDSGALITARYALEQGREVFAIPGPITSYLSDAPTMLLKQGAKLATDAYDILEELNIKNNPITPTFAKAMAGRQSTNNPLNERFKDLSKDEIKILEILQNETLHFDEIVRKSDISSRKLGGILTLLEMKKCIRSLENGIYSLVT